MRPARLLSPQHSIVRLVRIPHEWLPPAESVVNSPSGRICLANMVFSPAFDRAVGVYRARMVMTGGDHGELAAWRTSLSMVIASPACDFVVGVYCARMV